MSHSKFRPFHETIVDAVRGLTIEEPQDLEVLDALARLTIATRTPNGSHIDIGGAFAAKIRELEGAQFRRTEEVVVICWAAIESLGVQEDESSSM